MPNAQLRSVVRLILVAVLVSVAAGCDYYPRHRPGPPPYGPYYNDYYYYPHADVYFHIYTGEYYYRDGGQWRHSRALPPRIYLDPGDRRQLRIDSDRPYAHDRDRRHVPPPANTGPRYKPDRDRDRQERQYNKRRYEEYRKRYRN